MPTQTKRLIPALRHWFAHGAFLGAVLTAYNVVLGIIGIAPITTSDLKWWLFGIGAALSLATWYAMAANNARDERDAALDEKRHNEELNAAADLKATVEREAGKMRSDMAAMKELLRRGVPTTSPQVARLAESVAESAATIQAFVTLPKGGPFKVTGAPPPEDKHDT